MPALILRTVSPTTWSSSEQAYVPAEQPSAGQGPRFPRADAYPCWPRCPCRASPQGPRAARSLIFAGQEADRLRWRGRAAAAIADEEPGGVQAHDALGPTGW